MTGGHNLFRLYALVICDHCLPPPPPPPRGNVEDFDLVSAVPHSNHPTVGTVSWQNHDSSPPQSVIILHCHGCLCLSNTYASSASDFVWPSVPPYMGVIPNPKMAFIFPISCILVLIFPIFIPRH